MIDLIKKPNWPLLAIAAISLSFFYGGYRVFLFAATKTQSVSWGAVSVLVYILLIVLCLGGLVYFCINNAAKKEVDEHDPY